MPKLLVSLSDSTSNYSKRSPSADVLLAMEKDNRYLNTFVDMIVRTIQNDSMSGLIRPELEFVSSFVHFIIFQWRVGRSLGMEHVGISYHMDPKMSQRNEIQANFKNIVGKLRSILFPVFTILIPYILKRRRRNGWRELRRLLAGNRFITNNNYEELRGSARLHAFNEQRRRMAHYREHSNDAEVLESNSNNTPANTPPVRMVRSNLWRILKVFSSAFYSYDLIHNPSRAAFEVRDERVLVNHCTKALKWILRLHLALFFFNGKYYCLTQRVLGIQVRSNTRRDPHPSYRSIGLLIFTEGAASFLKSSLHLLIEAMHKLSLHRRRAARRRQQNLTADNDNRSIRHTPGRSSCTEDSVSTVLVESTVPSYRENNARVEPETRTGKNENQDNSLTCRICMTEPVNPAAAKCGHVFCWKCILHWTSNMRSECPLCRSPSKPQDIIALYGHCAAST